MATVVRGDTGAPVAGAAVTVAGRTYLADAAGNVRLEEAAAPGALVDVTAPSILDRQTTVGTGPLGTLALWPRTTASGIDEAFTLAIVYTSAALQALPPGEHRLRRLPANERLVVIVPSAEILADDVAHGFHAEAVSRMTAAAQGTVSYALARERPASGVVFDALLRPSDPSCQRARGFARLSLRNEEIRGGEIVYCFLDAARSATALHELGHTFGLQHSNDPREVMFGSFVRGRAPDLSARESDAMALMMQRRPGNRFPDSDREVAGASMREEIIVCR